MCRSVLFLFSSPDFVGKQHNECVYHTTDIKLWEIVAEPSHKKLCMSAIVLSRADVDVGVMLSAPRDTTNHSNSITSIFPYRSTRGRYWHPSTITTLPIYKGTVHPKLQWRRTLLSSELSDCWCTSSWFTLLSCRDIGWRDFCVCACLVVLKAPIKRIYGTKEESLFPEIKAQLL